MLRPMGLLAILAALAGPAAAQVSPGVGHSGTTCAGCTANVLAKTTGAETLGDSTITDNGGVTIGSPTGGAKGAGTLNAAGAIYINGTSIGTGPFLPLAGGTLSGAVTFASSTTGVGTETFTNSPCSALTVEQWIPIAITGQTGTWYVPACQ